MCRLRFYLGLTFTVIILTVGVSTAQDTLTENEAEVTAVFRESLFDQNTISATATLGECNIVIEWDFNRQCSAENSAVLKRQIYLNLSDIITNPSMVSVRERNGTDQIIWQYSDRYRYTSGRNANTDGVIGDLTQQSHETLWHCEGPENETPLPPSIFSLLVEKGSAKRFVFAIDNYKAESCFAAGDIE